MKQSDKHEQTEAWKPIPGWEGFYEASSMGRIRSLKRPGKTQFGIRQNGGKILKQIPHNNGYLVVNMTANGKRKQELVHKLVLEAFVGSRPDGMEACHNNGNRHDPRVENLRWDTRKANHADKLDHGTWQGGEASGTSKLTESAVIEIRQSDQSINEIAAKYGVSRGCIEKAKYRQTWRHL
jgi:hypothetical protein